MTEGATSGNSPAKRSTELELLVSLQLFGQPVDATATLASGADTILTVQFGDVTLGEMLTYLVSKAEPGLDFKLTPPWDLLNAINLHDLVFEVDLTNFRIGFSYDAIDVNIPLISLDRLEVWYSPATKVKNKSVDLSLFGSFLGLDFSSGPGLTWDLLNQPAPSVPGQGATLLDLRYLGIGQNVTLRDAASLATLQGVITALEGADAPAPAGNPLAALPALRFDASAGWLVGADFSLLDTVSLAAVFNDPVLYGLRLALAGSKAGLLAGLEFEILYRKVADNLGLYHIELQLPDALRKQQFGEANITFPVIDLDVYTNGDFLVDLGFPYNLDFSKSFQIDMIVWAGPIPIPVSAAAGLYFGVLDGQTSTQVPAVSNGSFAPVIVAGFGITVGLGYELSIGPLDAGFFAGIIGILEGVLAWFHPNADPDSPSVYVKVTGTVGIQIHIWGTVNFAVLQASLDIYAYAAATVVIESYQAIQVAFEAGISISLSIKVVFFTINLSFSATIRESVTFGQSSPAPWVIAATPGQGQLPAAQQSVSRDIVRSSGRVVQASPAFAQVLATGISWRDQTAPAAKLTIGVYLQPMPTAGLDGDRPGGSLGGPSPQLVTTLFVADHGQLEGALAVANAQLPLAPGIELTLPDGRTPLTRKSDGTRLSTAATPPYDTFSSLAAVCREASDVFSLGYLTRMVPRLLPPGAITLPDETATLDGERSYTVQAGDTLASIATRLLSPFEQLSREALLWALESAQVSVQQAGGAAAPTDGTGPDTPVSASHLHALYASLAGVVGSGAPFSLSDVVGFLNNRGIAFDLRPMPAGTAATAPDNPSFTVFPMPPFVQLTAQGTGIDTTIVDFGTGPYLADAKYQKSLARYFQDLAAPAPPPAGPQPAADPAAQAQAATAPGGPPDSVAAVLFTDYFTFILRQVVQDALDLYREYAYQLPHGSTDTLAGIADRFGITDPDLVQLNLDAGGLLAAGQLITFADGGTVTTEIGDTFRNLADRSGYSVTDLAAAAGAQPGLLRPGAALTLIDGTRYVVADGDTLLTIATTRQAGVTDQAAVAQIAEANKASTTFFKSGAQLKINQLSTQVIGGETLRTLAARLQLTPLLVATAIRGDTGVLAAGPTIQVSGGSYIIKQDDTFASIAAGLASSADQVAAALAAVTGAAAAVAGLLIPLTKLTLPDGTVYAVGPSDTLASIAAATGAALTDVATAAGDQMFAGVGFPLPTLPWTITDPAADSLDAIAARFGTTLAAVVAGANADALHLRTGAPVVFGLTTQTQPADTLTELASRFGMTTTDLAAALRDQRGLLAPGTTVQLPATPGTLPMGSYIIKRGDTLASIAAAFGTTDQAIMSANPKVGQSRQPCWSPRSDAAFPRPGMGLSMPVGLRINLPAGSSYQVGSQDTLASVAQTFGLSLAELLPMVVALPLTPQATVVLPPITYQVAGQDTPLSIAAQFGLTVQQLVLANTGAAFGTVIVPDAEILPLGTLVSDLAQAGSFDKPAGGLARFLLHGLRLPSPQDTPQADPADQRLYPMYTLTGQQFTPPATLPGDYGLTLAPNSLSPRPVLTFGGGTGPLTVPLSQADQTMLTGIAGQLAQSQPIDSGVLAATRYPPYAAVPGRYALGQPVPWQAASQPPLRYRYDPAAAGAGPVPAPRSGQPTLLPFPDALRRQIAASTAAAGPGLWVGLASGSKASPTAPTTTTPITGFGWATKIDFGLRQATDPNAPGQPLPNIYQVFGVDQDGPADLQLLLDYCLGAGHRDQLTLALAYPLSATSGSGPGLRSDPNDTTSVLLVKANLSTQSNPPAEPASAAAEVRALATPAGSGMVTGAAMSAEDARNFLLLLWEATITNSGGYYLYYQAGQNGPGLPAGIFSTDPTATVSLVITVFPHGGGSSTIPLRTCHNAALVTDNLADPNATVFAVPPQLPLPDAATLADLGLSLPALMAANLTTANLLTPGQQVTVNGASRLTEPGDDILTVALDLGQDAGEVVNAIVTDPDPQRYFNPSACVEVYPEWLTVSGALQPGSAGFRVVRTNPDPSDPDAPRPAADAPQDPATALQMLYNLVGYQLIANAGFRASADGLPAGPAKATSGPLNSDLTAMGGVEPWIYEKQLLIDRFATSQPAAALDGQQDPYAGVGATARFGWQPQDVFGNRLLAPQYIDVGIGYTDDLVALSQWPSVITGYLFAGPPGAAAIQVGVALDAGAYVATPGDVFAPVIPPGQASAPTSVAARARAHQGRYATIFWQLTHDLAAEVTTTVDDQVPHPLDPAGLTAFASGAWDYLGTVADSTQLTTTTGTNDTLASIAAAYHVSPAELAEANQSAAQNFAAASLLNPGARVTVDKSYVVVQNDTLAAIAQQAPASADPAGLAKLAAGNLALTLQPGTLLAVGPLRAVTAGDTLAAIATAAGLDRTQLANANGSRAGLLAAGTLLSARNYTVKAGDTLAAVAVAGNLTLGEAAAAVDAAGATALATGAQVVVPVPVPVTVGDSLAGVAARFGLGVAELGEANADADVLSVGAQLTLPGTGAGQVTVAAGDTLGSIATANHLAAGDLASVTANAGSTGLLRPGATLAAGYRPRAGDTLASVLAAFARPAGLTPEDIAVANAQVPGLLAPGQSVLLGTVLFPVQPGDTFASLAAATGASVADLATANASAGLLAGGQTLALPRHVKLAAGPGPGQDPPGTRRVDGGETLDRIASSTRQVTLLASANSDVTSLLAPGVQLSYPSPDGGSVTATTTPNDTLSTMAWRLQEQLGPAGAGQHITVALLGEANKHVPCLAAGALMLFPPADVAFSAPVRASNPRAVFKLETSLTLRRTAHVDPAVAQAGASAVTSVTTALAPAQPEGAAGQTVTLQQFAAAFETAFQATVEGAVSAPQLKLATTSGDSSGTQLFAVRYQTPTLNYTILGDTLAGIAARFGLPVTALAAAAAEVPGLVAAGVPIPRSGGGSYITAAADTLASIAAAQKVTVESLAADAAAVPGLLVPGVTIALPSPLPPYTVAAGTPYFFAPRPLSTALWNSPGPIPISGYTSAKGLGPAQPTAFTGIDLDGWARPFLAQLDLVLSSDYAVAAYTFDPDSYTALVRAKATLAAAIRDSVDYVVQPGSGPQEPDPRLAAAQDTLYQQLLITLSTAYQVDTIVQLPASVTAPTSADWTGDTAPRLRGQPAAAPYTVRAGDTLTSLAAHFQAPLELLLTELTGSGLLTPGFVVPGQGGQPAYTVTTVASGNKLGAVAAHFAVPVTNVAQLTDSAGHPLADSAGLLQAGVAVNLARRAYALAADDTLFSAISYLGLDVATPASPDAVANFAAMNATVPNVFAAGVTLQVPSAAAASTPARYEVKDGDTLTLIAGQLGVRVPWLVTTQLHVAHVLQAGTPVAYLSRVAGFSLSSADLSLVNGEENSLTFLFSTASSTVFSNLPVQLSYQVNQLEYGIQDVSWATGYQSSQWLTFLIPPPDDQIGTVDVPIPLRAYPVPPSVAGQTITPFTASHDAGPLTLQQLRRYDYDYTFSAQPAAQDTVSAGYLQNTVAAGTTSATARQGELPAALAQYASIRAGLEQDLALLTRMSPATPAAGSAGSQPGGGPAGQALQALKVLADLAGRVAQAWAPWVAGEVSPSTPPGPAPSAVIGAVPQYAPRYRLRRGTLATGEATVQLLPHGVAAAVHADDIAVGLAGHVAADGSGRAAMRQVVFTPVALPTTTGPTAADDFDLLVADRDVVTTQNIWGEVSVTRNANLLAGQATNPAFVYTVPEVKPISPGVPLISWTDPVDLAAVPFSPPSAPPGTAAGATRPLADWLVNFFDALLNRYAVLGADTLSKIALRYDLTLADLTPAVAEVSGLLTVCAQLPLPDGTSHTVAACDTLASVATANSVQVADLVQAAANASGLLAPGALIRPKAVCRNLRVAVDYSFPLATASAAAAGQQSEIVSSLPVLLYPMFLFDSATDLLPGSGFCASLARQLDAWATARGLPPDYGRWVLDVSLYTTLPGAAGAPPLLELSDVRLDRSVVKPATSTVP